MKKIILSWVLIISMVLMQVLVLPANFVVYGEDKIIDFISGEVSDWIGREPKEGDQTFYIEVRGNNLDSLEAEVSDYNNDIHTPIASQKNKWYLGNTSNGEERYIYEMIVLGGGTLNEESLYYIRLKDSENNYYDNNSAYFQCWGDTYSLSVNDLLSEISIDTEKLPFDLTLYGADTSLNKDELSLKLYSGIKENMWDDIILNSLVGISYDFETFVIGTGQIQIKGEFQITEDLVGGETLFAEVEYNNTKGYNNSPIHVVATSEVGQFKLTNAIKGKNSMGGGYNEGGSVYEAADNSIFYIGNPLGGLSVTGHRFTLTCGENISLASQLRVTDNNGTNILRNDSVSVSDPKGGMYTFSGLVDIPTNSEGIFFSYGEDVIHSVTLNHLETQGLVSVTPLNGQKELYYYKYAEGTSNFKVSLSGLNLPVDSESYSASLISYLNYELNEEKYIDCRIESTDGEIILNLTSDVPLTGEYNLIIYINNEEVKQLTYQYDYTKEEYYINNEGYPNLSIVFGEMSDEVDDSVIPPALTKITGNRALDLYGEGFSSDKDYKAHFMEHTIGGLSTSPQAISAQYVSSNKLMVSKEDTDKYARGWYEVYLSEDGLQINGFGQAFLLPEEDIIEIINPKVRINGGALFTSSQEVEVLIDPGSFTQVRFSESQEELKSMPYSNIINKVDFTISSEYGNKTIYFEFKNNDGNTYNTNVSINYQAGFIEAPSRYGIVGITEVNKELNLNKSSYYTLYMQAEIETYVCKVDIVDSSDNLIETITLNCTSSKDGINTYTKIISFEDENIKKIKFYYTDTYGIKSGYSEISVSIVEEPYIVSYRTDISTGYSLGEQYALSKSDIRLSVIGKPDQIGSAILQYKDGEGNTFYSDSIDLYYSNGEYYTRTQIPDGVAEIVSIEYKLKDPNNFSNYVTKTDYKNIKVFAFASFTGLDNNGEFYNKYLRLSNENGFSHYKIIGSNDKEFNFNNLQPGDYYYSIFDSDNTYKSGSFTAKSGVSSIVDLSDINKPASIKFNVSLEGGGSLSDEAYIQYVYERDGNTYNGNVRPNEIRFGLLEGMEIKSYQLILPYEDLKKYEYLEVVTNPITLNSGLNDNINISVKEVKKIKLKIKVTDADPDLSDRLIPGVSISAHQNVKNGSSDFYYSISGTTDDKGQLELSLYPGSKIYIDAVKDGYERLYQSEYVLTEESDQGIDIKLTYAEQNKLNINPFVLPIMIGDEDPDDLKPLRSDKSIYGINVKDEDGNDYYDFYYSNNTLYFTEDVSNKTMLIYPLMNYGYISKDVNYPVKLDEYGNGSVDVTAIQNGIIRADLINEQGNFTYNMLIYNESGKIATEVINQANDRLSTDAYALKDGKYTAVVILNNNISDFSCFYDIKIFDELNLKENVHYVKHDLTLEAGKIFYLGEIEIVEPIKKDMLYPYIVSFDSKYVPTSTDGSQGKIYIKYTVTVSDLFKNTIKLKKVNVSYSKDDTLTDKKINGIDSVFGELDYTPNSEGNYTISCTVDSIPGEATVWSTLDLTFERDGHEKTSYYGYYIDTPQVSIKAPKIISSNLSEINVSGIAFAGSKVDIYDGEIKVASVIADMGHKYSAKVALTSPEIGAVHVLKAIMTIKSEDLEDKEFISDEIICEIVEADKRAHISDFKYQNLVNNYNDTYEVSILGGSPGGIYRYNPNYDSLITFRINNLVSSQIEKVYVINTDRSGIKTKYPAELDADNLEGNYSDWIMQGNLGQGINDLSVFYSLKDGEDIGLLTGFRPPSQEDFESALTNLDKIDPVNVPKEFRNSAVRTEETETKLKAHKVYEGSKVGLEVEYSDVGNMNLNSQQLISQGFRKIPVGNSGEYYLIKDTSSYVGNNIRVERTMYLSSGLAETINNDNNNFVKGSSIEYATNSPIILASTSDTIRDISGKVDYVGYVQNTVETGYEMGYALGGSSKAAELGKLGTGMQVIGGVATVAQIFSGPASLDPANLRALLDKTTDYDFRMRMRNEIYEYSDARRDSHAISSIMGTVSYGSGFFSLPGKCLSYIVSTGNMVYTQKIDDEYNLWGNALLAEITAQLRKEEHDIGELDDVEDPQWLIDPSGYVFEALDSQRIEGIRATVQREQKGLWELWDDELLVVSNQENPHYTDVKGKYGWDVPAGNWRVLFEDETGKYQTAITKAMDVPPAHTEVNIGLLSTEAPYVSSLAADTSGIEIEFSKYMQAESIYDPDSNIINIQVFENAAGNELVPFEKIEFINPVDNIGYKADGIYQEDYISSENFVKRIKFIVDESLYPGGFRLYEDDGESPKKYTVIVSQNVLSYSGIPMGEDYVDDVEVLIRTRASEPVADYPGGNYPDPIRVSLTTSTLGADIYYTRDGSTPTTASYKYTGSLQISESCNLKALASKVGMDDSLVFTAVYLIGDAELIVSKPMASLAGGTYRNPQTISLTSSTEGASIYYTLDGSRPDNTSTLYKGPITISTSVSLKAIAIKAGYRNSSILTESYIIKPSSGSSKPKEEIEVEQPSIDDLKTLNFDDINEGEWYYESVKFVVEKGLFKGVEENKFGPHLQMTRAMLVTILFRLDGEQKVEKTSFNDILSGSWYEEAVNWAAQNTIVKGYGEGLFGPNESITREQLATILYRYAQMEGYDINNLSDVENFIDYNDISDWALTPIKWMVANNLLKGRPGNIIDPKGYATRAEVAAIFHRFIGD